MDDKYLFRAAVNSYIAVCQKTAVYPEEVAAPYLALGFCSEAAELTQAGFTEVIKELGDCQWYMCRLASQYGYDFTDLAEEGRHVASNQGTQYSLSQIAGLIAGHIKKQIRDGKDWTGEQREEVRREIQTLIIHGIAESIRIAYSTNQTSYLEVLSINSNKLISRLERGTLKGSGDNR